MMNLASHLTHPVFKRVGELADERGQRAFVIGGFVRDLLLDRPCKDIDIVTEGSGIELARATAQSMGIRQVHVFKNFGTAMFKARDYEVEFVGARKGKLLARQQKTRRRGRHVGRRPKPSRLHHQRHGHQPERRLVWQAGGPVRRGRRLEPEMDSHPLDPDVTYSDDPLRMLRAVRFASQLGFRIEEGSLASIRRNAKRLSIISAERIHTEVNKIILSPRPSRGFKLLFKTKLLHKFFPEMAALQGVEWRKGVGHKDNFYHTLEVLDNVAEHSDSLWLRWAAIMHDIAKPPTKRFDARSGWTFHGHEDRGARMVPKIFARMKLPMDAKMKYVQKLVLLHLRPIALTKDVVTDSAVRRLLFEAGDDIDDLMILCRADITSKNEAKVERYLRNYDVVVEKLREVEEKDHIRNFQPPVSGEEIMEAFGIPPSRPVGDIKNAIKEAILDGDIRNDVVEAKRLMLELGAQMGLTPSPSSRP